MLLKISFYLTTENNSQQGKTIDFISELVKIHARCYVLSKYYIPELEEFDPQYCIIRDNLLFNHSSNIPDNDSFYKSEREFLTKKKIRIIISDNPNLFRKISKDHNIINIDLHKILDSQKAILKATGKIVQKYVSTYNAEISYAVFDVGTNNVQLVWAMIDKDRIEIIHRASQISAMGKNMQNGLLTKAGIERTKKILKEFLRISTLFTNNIILIGTSCSRESKNINLLIDWLKKKYDLAYQIISDQEEAELVGLANRKLFNEFKELIIFDIGGGSTEFIFYRGIKKIYQNSIQLGIRRIENYKNDNQQKKIEYIRQKLNNLPVGLLKKPFLVGIGGTVTNISAVKQSLIYYDSAVVHKRNLSKSDIEFYLKKFKKLTLDEISKLMPFEPLRANVITTGLLIILEIMNYFGQDSIFVSDYGLQFGVLERIRLKASGIT
ncbi:MAG: hypothetical protein K0B81_04880 [Candidatus Cloacimonetes bacterium]|nr:hypothetical protein [Candidatus Cloacimonadota bacterium]